MFYEQERFSKPLLKLRYILFFLPSLLFITGLDDFPFPAPDAEFSDMAISHYPYAMYIRKSILTFHQIPLWYQTIYSGHPLAGNPLAGLWYPPGWLALLFPLPLGLNIMALLHIVGGIAGMYFYLRSISIKDAVAFLVSILFGFMPKMIAHYGAGHLSLVYAISWTPWLLYSVKSAIQGRKNIALPVIFLSLSILADIRWGYIMTLFLGIYVLFYPDLLVSESFTGKSERGFRLRIIFVKLKWLAKVGLLSSLLSAPLLIPLSEFILHSSRRYLAGEDIFTYSLHPVRLILGLLYPDWGGYHEFVVYVGGVGLLVAFMYLLIPEKDYDRRYWMFIFLISTLIALGEFFPLNRFLTLIPGYSLLRVPTRVLFLMQVAAIVWIASVLSSLQKGEEIFVIGKKAKLLLFGLVGLGFLLGIAAAMIEQSQSENYLWGSITLLISYIGLLSVLHQSNERKRQWLSWGLLILIVLDWGVFDRTVLYFRETNEVMSESAEVAKYLNNLEDAPFRVYSPSYALPQQVAVFYSLELADGVEPMQLSSYVEYMDDASGVPRHGYSVTIPPYYDENPHTANIGIIPDMTKLGRLNVKYVLSDFPLDDVDLQLIYQRDGKWLYKNDLALPRAWVQHGEANEYMKLSSTIIKRIEPNRIDLVAQGPGLLVLSENNYPGWKVSIDGEESVIEPVYGLLRGVSLPEGSHNVEFIYQPLSVYLGIVFFIVGIFCLLVLV